MSIAKKIRYKLEWFGLQVLYLLIPLLPRRAAHGLSRGLGSLGYLVDRRGRETAIENLTLVFGEEKSKAEIEKLARNSYRSFAQTVVDQFWSSRLNSVNFEDYCKMELDDRAAAERAK
ncbi:MAG: hypothetical protein AAGA96_20410, partial [Verrucomicrobiota bacterium]